MPKMKTHSGAKKRFKVTGSGKIVHKRSNNYHLRRKKSKSNKLRLAGKTTLDSSNQSRVKDMLVLQ